MFSEYKATAQEVQMPLPGDDLLPLANLAVNSAFSLRANPEEVWPWIVQLGKGRAGWYLPSCVPNKWQGAQEIIPSLQHPEVGDDMGDWMAQELTFVTIVPPEALVLRGTFDRTATFTRKPKRIDFSWALALSPTEEGTRVHSRTRLGPVEHERAAAVIGGLADRMVAKCLAEGLEQRLARNQKQPLS